MQLASIMLENRITKKLNNKSLKHFVACDTVGETNKMQNFHDKGTTGAVRLVPGIKKKNILVYKIFHFSTYSPLTSIQLVNSF